MDDMTVFEQQLAAGFQGLMGPSEPVDDAAILAAVATTRSPRWVVRPLFGVARFVVAGAIVVLFVGALLAGALTQPRNETTPAAVASASPAAEAEPTDTDAEQADSTDRADLAGSFSQVSYMTDRRAGHTATLLPDGRVLVVGGGQREDGSAEIWDPDTGSFTPTGSLSVPRRGHTATLLPDGRVLVVGGSGPEAQADLTAAEVWDPGTGAFESAGSLAEGRSGHTATLLDDGRVLVVGGYLAQSFVETAEVWDPVTSSFGTAELLAAARIAHTATRLDDGRVLIVGGEGPSGGADLIVDPPAEVWDPVTGVSSPAGSLAERRMSHSATLLADGRVLIVGGKGPKADQAYARTTTAEVWDPRTASFGPAGSPLIEDRGGYTATLLPDGRVLVIGGDNGKGEDYAVYAGAETWDPETGSFSPAGSLLQERTAHTATLLPDGRVLVLGGMGPGNGSRSSAEIWEPAGVSSSVNETAAMTTGPATALPIQLPADLPDGLESGTLDTPLGPARSVHLAGDETTVPPGLRGLLATPDGYVVPQWGGPFEVVGRRRSGVPRTSSTGLRSRWAS